MGRKSKLKAGQRAEMISKKSHPKISTASKSAKFPIVGVGASAGGLEAFTQLLQNLPTDTGMAFVLVQHLDPKHESALTRLLSQATTMPVSEVKSGALVAPNCVYVIPPNVMMSIAQGHLKLQPRAKTNGANRSIDFFFESLAQDQKECAIGIVLSGTAMDGTQGLEAIKAEGGITFVQDASAKYDSMPRSAYGAGCVDFVLSPKEIANELTRIAKHPLVPNGNARPELLIENEKHFPKPHEAPHFDSGEGAFKKILHQLHNHRGVDFSLYKAATIQRRITRRMVLNKLNSLTDYAAFLKSDPYELDALYSDALISVTGFFRNPEVFETLKSAVFPKLLHERRRNDPVRIWTLGCSTGQEAYSIAMAYLEFASNVPNAPNPQIFATDINEAHLEKARQGLYAANLVTDVSPERLRRFFTEEQRGYRVSKQLREFCVFARQNVLSDPPFSRMDLISCRNLLIYIEADLQKKILPNFHYALKPHGFLLLGTSESIGSFTNLFEPADKKQKIFTKKVGAMPAYHLPVSAPYPAQKKDAAKRETPADSFRVEPNPQREADRVVASQFAPPGVLINADLEVIQFRGSTNTYLEPPTGKASFDVLKMAKRGLMLPLRAAINQAKKENRLVSKTNIRLEGNGRAKTVSIEVIPLKNLREICYLVLFKELGKGKSAVELPEVKKISPKQEATRIAGLENELAETRDYIQSLQEQHEAAHEELQSSSEEVQSANEELQSINEELETSKEELESTNEELITVNEEMAARNIELNRLNNDLNNFHVSINTAILLLGRDLTVRRFTPLAEKIFNLLTADVGRPLSTVRHNLNFPDLEEFISGVIDSVSVREREVQDKDRHWYSVRVRPYLTLEKKVDGAVLMLVDVDALKRSEQAVAEAREMAEAVIRTVPEPLLVLDGWLRVQSANDAFYRTFKLTLAGITGRLIYELDYGSWNIPRLRQLLEEIIPRNSFFNDFEVTHNFERIGQRTLLLNARMLNTSSGNAKMILVGIRDITEVLAFQTKLRRSELRYRRLFEAAKDGVLIIDPSTRKIVDANPFMTELLGYSREELLGKELYEIGLLKDEETNRTAFQELQEKHFTRYENLPLKTKTGEHRNVEVVGNLYREGDENIVQCNIRDMAGRKRDVTASSLMS